MAKKFSLLSTEVKKLPNNPQARRVKRILFISKC